jgi:predicted transcriptional regulator
MLGRAPGFVRSMVKASLRKEAAGGTHGKFIVMTQDEGAWRSYFGVSDDKDAYVVLLDAGGRVLWHGHGAAGNLEPLVRAALK